MKDDRLLKGADWEKVHEKAGCDLIDMVMDFTHGRINANELMESIAKRCDITAEQQDAKTGSILRAKIRAAIEGAIVRTETHYNPNGNIGSPDSTGGVINIGKEYYLMDKDAIQAVLNLKEGEE